MNTTKRKTRKALSVLFSALLVFGLVPTTAFAGQSTDNAGDRGQPIEGGLQEAFPQDVSVLSEHADEIVLNPAKVTFDLNVDSSLHEDKRVVYRATASLDLDALNDSQHAALADNAYTAEQSAFTMAKGYLASLPVGVHTFYAVFGGHEKELEVTVVDSTPAPEAPSDEGEEGDPEDSDDPDGATRSAVAPFAAPSLAENGAPSGDYVDATPYLEVDKDGIVRGLNEELEGFPANGHLYIPKVGLRTDTEDGEPVPVTITQIAGGVFPGTHVKGIEFDVNSEITVIAARAFQFLPMELKDGRLPSGLTLIREATFQGTSISSVVVPADVSAVDAYAFADCASLSSATFAGNAVTAIRGYAFAGSGLAAVSIPESVNLIGEYAFRGCGSLVDVDLPTTLDTLSIGAFSDCPSLGAIQLPTITTFADQTFRDSGVKSVAIPSGITAIPSSTFDGCTSLASVTFEAGSQLKTIEYLAFQKTTALKSISFPGSLELVENSAFASSGLTAVTFEDGTADLVIGMLAFSYAPIVEVYLPTRLKEIGVQAFGRTGGTTKPIVHLEWAYPSSIVGGADLTDSRFCTVYWKTADDNSWWYVDEGTGELIGLRAAESWLSGATPPPHPIDDTGGKVVVPGKVGTTAVTSVMPWAFQNNGDIVSVAFDAIDASTPSAVTTIEPRAFSGCSSLEEITLPGSLATIGEAAFAYTRIANLVVPDSVTSFGSMAFLNNSVIESITFGAGIQSIGGEAHRIIAANDSKSLKDIYLTQHLTDSIPGAPWEAEYATIHWSDGETPPVRNKTDDWEYSVQVIDGVKTGTITKYLGGSTTDLKVPAKFDDVVVTTIAPQTFPSSVTFSNVTIEEGIVTISERAFGGGGTSGGKAKISGTVYIPKTVTSIGPSAFDACEMSHVEFASESALTTIGAFAFRGNTLTNLVLPKNLKTVMQQAFDGSGIVSLTLPASLATIGASAFANNSIEAIDLPEFVEKIESNAFRNNKLTAVELKAGTYAVGSGAFSNNLIETVKFPDTPLAMGSFGSGVFSFNNMKTVELPSWMTSLPTYIFSDNLIETLDIPYVTYVGTGAFSNNKIVDLALPSVVSVNANAFSGNAIEHIAFGPVASIGEEAFANNNLRGVLEIPASIAGIASNSFTGNPDVAYAVVKMYRSQASSSVVNTINYGLGYEADGVTPKSVYFDPAAGSPSSTFTKQGPKGTIFFDATLPEGMYFASITLPDGTTHSVDYTTRTLKWPYEVDKNGPYKVTYTTTRGVTFDHTHVVNEFGVVDIFADDVVEYNFSNVGWLATATGPQILSVLYNGGPAAGIDRDWEFEADGGVCDMSLSAEDVDAVHALGASVASGSEVTITVMGDHDFTYPVSGGPGRNSGQKDVVLRLVDETKVTFQIRDRDYTDGIGRFTNTPNDRTDTKTYQAMTDKVKQSDIPEYEVIVPPEYASLPEYQPGDIRFIGWFLSDTEYSDPEITSREVGPTSHTYEARFLIDINNNEVDDRDEGRYVFEVDPNAADLASSRGVLNYDNSATTNKPFIVEGDADVGLKSVDVVDNAAAHQGAYRFAGWLLAGDPSGKLHGETGFAENELAFVADTIKAPITYTAVYDNRVQFKWDATKGSLSNPFDAETSIYVPTDGTFAGVAGSSAVPVLDPTQPWYNFVGWSSDDGTTMVADPANEVVVGPVMYTAVFSENPVDDASLVKTVVNNDRADGTYYAGDSVTYTVEATNESTEASSWDAVVTDVLDDKLVFAGESAVRIAGGEKPGDSVAWDEASRTLTVTLAGIGQNQSRSFSFGADIADDAVDATIPNAVTAPIDGGTDPEGEVTIETENDVDDASLVKTVVNNDRADGTYYAGDSVTYTVEATNESTEASSWDAVVTDVLDDKLVFAGESAVRIAGGEKPGDSVAWDEASRTLTVTLAGIGQNQSRSFSFGADIADDAVDATIPNAVTAPIDGGTDPEGEVTIETERHYTVKYDLDGGSQSDSTSASNPFEDRTDVYWVDNNLLPSEEPVKKGYVFKQWEYNGQLVLDDKTYGDLAVDPTVEEITLKAVWVMGKPGYTDEIVVVANPFRMTLAEAQAHDALSPAEKLNDLIARGFAQAWMLDTKEPVDIVYATVVPSASGVSIDPAIGYYDVTYFAGDIDVEGGYAQTTVLATVWDETHNNNQEGISANNFTYHVKGGEIDEATARVAANARVYDEFGDMTEEDAAVFAEHLGSINDVIAANQNPIVRAVPTTAIANLGLGTSSAGDTAVVGTYPLRFDSSAGHTVIVQVTLINDVVDPVPSGLPSNNGKKTVSSLMKTGDDLALPLAVAALAGVTAGGVLLSWSRRRRER
ncbi:leucine-rich repeat protein [Gordonibacter sp. 28C]|uniref:leucine-rich repeat protein n=1 Tax=Gordonibacter sp. 28C TaxID=2078569 RepID=UPI0013145318|nr:leucine-rich repeat protein [Gordonibacter sp. 28C]